MTRSSAVSPGDGPTSPPARRRGPAAARLVRPAASRGAGSVDAVGPDDRRPPDRRRRARPPARPRAGADEAGGSRRGGDRARLVDDLFHRRPLGPQRTPDAGGAAGRGRAVHRHALLRGALDPRKPGDPRRRPASGRRIRTRSRSSPASCATAASPGGQWRSRRRCASSSATVWVKRWAGRPCPPTPSCAAAGW